MADTKTFEQLQAEFNEANLDAVIVHKLALELGRNLSQGKKFSAEYALEQILKKYINTGGTFISKAGLPERVLKEISYRMVELIAAMKEFTDQNPSQLVGK